VPGAGLGAHHGAFATPYAAVKKKACLPFPSTLFEEINRGYPSTGFVYRKRPFNIYNSECPIRKWPILQYGGSRLAGGI
jgi:hypothetical protein